MAGPERLGLEKGGGRDRNEGREMEDEREWVVDVDVAVVGFASGLVDSAESAGGVPLGEPDKDGGI